MPKVIRRPNVTKGTLVPLGNGFSLAIGKHPNKTDDIDIGPNNKNGLSVNHGEILQNTGNSIRVFSAEPMLKGISPAQLLYGGMPANEVFALQEQYKRTHRIADDGSHYKIGGDKVFELIKRIINKKENQSTRTITSLVKRGVDWSGIKTTKNRPYNSNYIDYINTGLVNAGIGKNQRAAILANIIEESGGDPFVIDSTGNFGGILQWSKSRYWPSEEKDPYKELDKQIKYIVDTEKNSTDKVSWTHGGKGSGYNSLTDAMAAYNSEDDLAATMKGYTLGYVRPAGGINSYNNRYKVAEQLISKEGFKNGGIYIKPSKRGTFTTAAKKHGMSVQAFASKVLANKGNYSSAMVKKANFAKNASKWHHLFGGEDTLINPLGERPNANNENMNNKRTKAVVGTQQPLRTLAEIEAAKAQLGKYYNTFYNNDGTVKRQIPTFGELQGTTLSKADQQMYKQLWGNDFYNANVDPNGKIVGIDTSKIDTLNNSGPKSYLGYNNDKLNIGDNTIYFNRNDDTGKIDKALMTDSDGNIYEPFSQKDTLQPQSSIVSNTSKQNVQGFKNFILSDAGVNIGSALIHSAGSIISNIINQRAIRNLRFTPRQYTLLHPVKLKTKININPQLAKMRETVAALTDAAKRTSASSRTAYQKIANTRERGLQAYMSLLGDKENKETSLINQDRLNQQHVAHKNADRIMNVINTNIAGGDELNNRKRMLSASSNIDMINSIAGSITGERGLLDRRAARRSQAANLAAMSMAYPDAARMLQGDNWQKAFDAYYDMLNHKIGV